MYAKGDKMFWQEVVKLTTEISWIVIAMLSAGLVLCVIEAIIPSYGFVGISGLALLVGGVVVHAIISGSVLQVVIIIAILLLILTLIVLLFIRSAKYGVLGKSALVENKTAIPVDYADNENDKYSDLQGQIGVVVAECKPVGKIKIDSKIVDVLSRNDLLLVGEQAIVVDIQGSNVYVKRVKGEGYDK